MAPAQRAFRPRETKAGAASTVFIVDDNADDRDRLRAIAESVGLDVATFGSARDFLGAYLPTQPGCLVLDLRMPGMDGLDLQAELAQRAFSIPIIFVTAYAEVRAAVQAMHAGALDFLSKPVCERELLQLIRVALERDARERAARTERELAAARFRTLSAREREVLEHVLRGHHSKEIAYQLAISPRTVDVHRANINHKLGATCLPDLYRLVVQAGAAPYERGVARHITEQTPS